MNKEKILEQIKKSFDEDLKKELNPLYDISQHVHQDTLSELRELFETVGNYAYNESKKEVFDDIKKQKQQLIKEIDKKLKPLEDALKKKEYVNEDKLTSAIWTYHQAKLKINEILK